eukprot:jgi/Bigna1/84300/fgenesh1_pg.129_\
MCSDKNSLFPLLLLLPPLLLLLLIIVRYIPSQETTTANVHYHHHHHHSSSSPSSLKKKRKNKKPWGNSSINRRRSPIGKGRISDAMLNRVSRVENIKAALAESALELSPSQLVDGLVRFSSACNENHVTMLRNKARIKIAIDWNTDSKLLNELSIFTSFDLKQLMSWNKDFLYYTRCTTTASSSPTHPSSSTSTNNMTQAHGVVKRGMFRSMMRVLWGWRGNNAMLNSCCDAMFTIFDRDGSRQLDFRELTICFYSLTTPKKHKTIPPPSRLPPPTPSSTKSEAIDVTYQHTKHKQQRKEEHYFTPVLKIPPKSFSSSSDSRKCSRTYSYNRADSAEGEFAISQSPSHHSSSAHPTSFEPPTLITTSHTSPGNTTTVVAKGARRQDRAPSKSMEDLKELVNHVLQVSRVESPPSYPPPLPPTAPKVKEGVKEVIGDTMKRFSPALMTQKIHCGVLKPSKNLISYQRIIKRQSILRTEKAVRRFLGLIFRMFDRDNIAFLSVEAQKRMASFMAALYFESYSGNNSDKTSKNSIEYKQDGAGLFGRAEGTRMNKKKIVSYESFCRIGVFEDALVQFSDRFLVSKSRVDLVYSHVKKARSERSEIKVRLINFTSLSSKTKQLYYHDIRCFAKMIQPGKRSTVKRLDDINIVLEIWASNRGGPIRRRTPFLLGSALVPLAPFADSFPKEPQYLVVPTFVSLDAKSRQMKGSNNSIVTHASKTSSTRSTEKYSERTENNTRSKNSIVHSPRLSKSSIEIEETGRIETAISFSEEWSRESKEKFQQVEGYVRSLEDLFGGV